MRPADGGYEVAIKGRTNAIIAAVIARLTQTEADILEDYLAGDTAMEITRRRKLQSLECRAITLTIIHKLLAANRVIWKTLIEVNPDILARIEAFVVKYGVADGTQLSKQFGALSKEHQALLEQSLHDGSLEAFLRSKAETATTSTPNRDAAIVPNPSGWVPTAQLPPDVATAVRAAGAMRQRAYRSKMSETEKAEERAKAAARMRARRSRSPEP